MGEERPGSLTRTVEILRYRDGRYRWEDDLLVEECRVDIWVGGRPYASMMATPAELDHLALGYLFSEGAITSAAQVRRIEVQGRRVKVEVEGPPPQPPQRARSSGFGLGLVSLSGAEGGAAGFPRARPAVLKAETIVELMEEFNRRSQLFERTGAVHSAWLVIDRRRFFAEDVGRHNALDKVVGQYLRAESAPREPGLALTTGRVSTEMVLKAARAGLGALISRAAASDRALDLARQLNLILIDFARGRRFNILHGGELIEG